MNRVEWVLQYFILLTCLLPLAHNLIYVDMYILYSLSLPNVHKTFEITTYYYVDENNNDDRHNLNLCCNGIKENYDGEGLY